MAKKPIRYIDVPAEERSVSFPDWSLGFSARKIAYYSGDPAVTAQFTWSETAKFPGTVDLPMDDIEE